MLKIGVFSKLSRVSIRMLRHYDEIDLLKPVQIDEMTGYRYYSVEQLPVIARINSLKDMGFGLIAIKEIMQCYNNREELERYLRIRHAEIAANLQETAYRLQLLETAIERLGKDEIMNCDVVLKSLPERQVASVRQVISCYEQEGLLWNILFQETNHMNLKFVEPMNRIAIFHDKEHKEKDVDVEVQVAVKGNYSDTENVKFRKEAEQSVASVVFKGSYEQFSNVYASLATWVEANGYEYCGPMCSLYHVSPNETQNPEEFVTEVCCPVRKK